MSEPLPIRAVMSEAATAISHPAISRVSSRMAWATSSQLRSRSSLSDNTRLTEELSGWVMW